MPHPFDRMHAVPDYEHLLDVVDDVDAIEVYNPRDGDRLVQRGGAALRRQVPHRGGAGSDAHVAQGLGSVRIRMPDFDGPRGVPRGAARRAEIITQAVVACSTCRR